jgi:hypothetical protein
MSRRLKGLCRGTAIGGGLVHHTLPHGGDLVVVSACSESVALGSPSQSS